MNKQDIPKGCYLPVEAGEGTEFFTTENNFDPKSQQAVDGVKTLVVKLGGSTLGRHDTTLEDVISLQQCGTKPVIVHGGGNMITEWMAKQGLRPKFVQGLRVTDDSNIQVVVAVLAGVVNKAIVASINALGGKAVGLSGVDGGMLRAKPLSSELGLVGRVVDVDPTPVLALVQAGYIPVVAPVASPALSSGVVVRNDSVLNVNADTAAGEIAAALNSDRLVIMTDVEGVLDSSSRLIPRLTKHQAEGLLRSKVVHGGMVPKIGACLKALENGRMANIIDGRQLHSLEDTLAGKILGTRVG